MATNTTTDFKILAKVVLDVDDIRKQLEKVSKGLEIKLDHKQVDDTAKSMVDLGNKVKETDEKVEDASITWQQYREMLNLATRAIESFVGQTMEMDEALTEFKKVSTLSGDELDRYVDKLAKAGKQVARTGKPNRSEPE